jgi:phytoene dehydrogenase-like protein
MVAPGEQIGSTTLALGYSILNYAFDRTMAPAGKSVVILRYESPYELWAGMPEDIYHKEKKQIRADAIRLLEKEYPGISEDIDVCDVATPLTAIRYTGVYKGAYTGFVPTPRSIRDSLPMTIPGLRGFYLAGQWLFPGGGLPPAAQSGKWAVQRLCRQDRREFRAWAV